MHPGNRCNLILDCGKSKDTIVFSVVNVLKRLIDQNQRRFCWNAPWESGNETETTGTYVLT